MADNPSSTENIRKVLIEQQKFNKEQERSLNLSKEAAKYVQKQVELYSSMEKQLEGVLDQIKAEGQFSGDMAKVLAQSKQSVTSLYEGLKKGNKEFSILYSSAEQSLKVMEDIASKALPGQRDALNRVIEKQKEALQIAKQQKLEAEAAQNAAELTSRLDLSKSFSSVGIKMSKIPILGKHIESSFRNAGEAAQKDFGEKIVALGPKSGKATSQIGAAFSSMAGQAKNALTGIMKHPWLIILAVAVKWIQEIYEAWNKVNQATIKFADSTGAVGDQLLKGREYIVAANVSLAEYGVTLEIAGESAAALANTFQNIGMLSQSLVNTTSLMVSNLGMSVQEAADYAKHMKAVGNLTDDQLKNMTGLVAEASRLGGVMPKKVMSDIAKSARTINLFFRGNTAEIGRQAIQMNRLGLSLQKAGSMAEKLLDWDTNITAEMEASVMLGRQINLQNARWLAWEGDIAGMTEEVLRQVGSLNEFNKMNILQKKAIASATGMEVEELSAALKQQEQMRKLAKDPARLNEYNKMMAAMNTLNEQNDLLLKTQKQFATQKLSQAWDKIITLLTTALVPLLDYVILPAIDWLTNQLRSISEFFENITGSSKDISGNIKSVNANLSGMKSALSDMGETIKPILEILGYIGKFVGYTFKQFVRFSIGFTNSLVAAGASVLNIFNGVKEVINAIFSGESYLKGWYGILKGMSNLVKSILTMALTLMDTLTFGVFSEKADALQKAVNKMSLEKNIKIPEKADGGIVTRPTIAMVGEAGPEAIIPLGNEHAGITTLDNSDVVKKLDELIFVMRNGFGVYMDGIKVGDAILEAAGNPAMSNAVN